MNDDHLPATKGDLRTHGEDDIKFQKLVYEDFSKRLEDLPSRADLAKLATKADVEEVVNAYKRFIKATDFVEKGGKWTWRAVSTIAAIILALSVLTGAWKVLLAWFGTSAAHGMIRP